jgi:hypothetical protein
VDIFLLRFWTKQSRYFIVSCVLGQYTEWLFFIRWQKIYCNAFVLLSPKHLGFGVFKDIWSMLGYVS